MINLSKTNLTFAVTYESQYESHVTDAIAGTGSILIRFYKPNANSGEVTDKSLTIVEHKPCKGYLKLTLLLADLVTKGEWVADIIYQSVGGDEYTISRNNANIETESRVEQSNGAVIEE